MVSLTIFQSEKLQYILISEFRERIELVPKENKECTYIFNNCCECFLNAVFKQLNMCLCKDKLVCMNQVFQYSWPRKITF